MALKDEPSPKCTFLNATSETRLKLRLFSLLRRFATSCSQPARQSQKAWLCTTCATAKHHLISCPKRSKGTLKRGPNATSETRLTPSVQKTAPGWEKCVSKLRNGASATPKQQGPKGRTGPAGNGPNGLTLLSEPTRKVAVFELSKLRNGASATPKQQGPEGRTGPADNGPNCLTLLSEITRKVAIF